MQLNGIFREIFDTFVASPFYDKGILTGASVVIGFSEINLSKCPKID